MHRLVRLSRGSIGVVGVIAVLISAAPDPAALRDGLADADRWVQRDGLDLVLAQLVGAVAWLAALWLAMGLALVAGSRLPGALGRASGALARGALPAGVRRTAALALGVSLATSTLPGLGAASAGAHQAAADHGVAGSEVLPTGGRSTVDRTEPSAAGLLGVERPEASAADFVGVERADPSAAEFLGMERADPSAADFVGMERADASAADFFGVERADASAAGFFRVDWPVSGVPANGVPETAGAVDRVDWPLDEIPDVEAVTPSRPDTSVVDWPVVRSTIPSPVDQTGPSIVDWPAGNSAVTPPAGGTTPSIVDWPGATSATAPPAGGTRPSIVDWPVGRSATAPPTARTGPSSVDWPAAPDRSTARPLGATRRVLVVVRPGDTLWSLASRRLGPGATAPAIAAEWRRWHAANHDVIGPDPRRLRTGVSLRVPGKT